jgi:hypothetical protein
VIIIQSISSAGRMDSPADVTLLLGIREREDLYSNSYLGLFLHLDWLQNVDHNAQPFLDL